jgi:hypothetical protein
VARKYAKYRQKRQVYRKERRSKVQHSSTAGALGKTHSVMIGHKMQMELSENGAHGS